MTNREMLELAAKAAGLDLEYCPAWNCMSKRLHDRDGAYFDSQTCWNPLTVDGDAFRLAVQLNLDILTPDDDGKCGVIFPDGSDLFIEFDTDPYTATRMAIVRAAAEIGKDLK